MRWLAVLLGLTLMPSPSVPPPLRVRNPDGTFNQIPVFELEVSGGTLQKVSPIRTRLIVDSGAGATGAPVGAEYITYAANATLTAERILTAGSSVVIVTDGTNIYVSALTGGGGTTVYAATGNQYVTISAAADLTDEYLIRGSTGISLTSAGNILFVHYGSLLVTTSRSVSTLYPLTGGGDLSADRTVSVDTAFLVNSGRAINTTLPLSGGGILSVDRTFTIVAANNTTAGAIAAADFKDFNLGRVTTDRTITTLYPLTGGGLNLSADRTFSADTAFLVTSTRAINTTAPLAGGGNLSADRTFTVDTLAVVVSGRTISTLFPLSGGANLSADRTFSADTAFLITSARTISFGSGFLVGGGDLSANRTITYSLPIGVGTGGTGQTSLTAQGILYGSGASAVQATSGLNAGMIAVGSGLGMNLQLIGSGATGQVLISTGGSVAGNVAWVNTLGGASGAVYAPTGGAYVTWQADADLTAEKTLTSGTGMQVSTDSTTVFVNLRTGGATGQMLVTSGGVTAGVAWVATGGGGSSTVYAATGNEYIVAAAAGDLTAERVLVAGTMIKVDTATAGQVIISQTGKTVTIPLALLTVQPDSSNAFWTARTGANIDMGYVTFMDAGEGLATWWTQVPWTLAPAPLWNIDIYSTAGTATAAGTGVFTVRAKAVTHGEDFDTAAYTIVSSALNTLIFRSDTLTITAASGGNFDSVVSLSSRDFLLVEINRHGGTANDGINDSWNVWNVSVRMNVL